jgi:N-succinyldiaminopimelate aminotransferase
MNPDLERLQPYPFEKLRALFAGAPAPQGVRPVNLSIGEPKHPTPQFIREALIANLGGLASYPPTLGSAALREAVADWIAQRFGVPRPDPGAEVLPVNGSREALFAFAQTVIDRTRGGYVLCPNPFYQIYEGAALLAGARPFFVNAEHAHGFRHDYAAVPEQVLAQTQMVFVCSPGNPTGRVMSLDEWRDLFALSDRYGFVIAADECYSEIYCDASRPPLGALSAAHRLGRGGYDRLVVFSSLSKRSNVPGMRSGFVAGDRKILSRFLLYRTYHGGAMSPAFQAASVAAWRDETHVVENRRLYAAKFAQALPLLDPAMDPYLPEGGFYLWLRTPIPDEHFARQLHAEQAVDVLPGSYLARTESGLNPGAGRIRIALVAELAECLEGVARIAAFARTLNSN